MPITITELAYAAGIIDGEGCISVSYKSTVDRFEVSVQVAMKEPHIPEWLADRFGSRVFCYKQSKMAYKDSTYWKWALYGKRAQHFIEQIKPYLVGKTVQAEEASKFIILSLGQHHSDDTYYTNALIRDKVMFFNSGR